MKTTPRVQTLHAKSIDHFADAFGPDWHTECRQLNSGPFYFEETHVDLDGVNLCWDTFGASVAAKQTRLSPGFTLNLILSAPSPALVNCREVGLHSIVLVTPNTPLEYTAPEGIQVLTIDVDFDRFPFDFDNALPHPVTSVDPTLKDKLVTLSSDITESLKSNTASTRELNAYSDEVLHLLTFLLEPYFSPSPSEQKEIAKALRSSAVLEEMKSYLRDLSRSSPPSISEMAEQLSLSEATAYRLFKNWCTIPPYQFHLIEKLHCFRTRLIEKPETSVTNAALEAGFSDYSRAIQQYRHFFGETPSATLRLLF
ncbi:helix-turn-helix domain-containing protein [Rubritalea marina]|uniref:helix-turn-helix domain-containing protein n=1 Tax=Rubritalea marina TaxID=361055 RepID=UPI0003721F29|nr:helix-turn-helix domain-containing protein [Rubritalea marina]